MTYETLIDKLMQYYTGEPYLEEVAEAKAEFFKRAGIFDEESPQFEMKMAQFADWYLFTRKLKENNRPPVQTSYDENRLQLSGEEKDMLRNLRDSRHSLFEFLKLKNSDVHIKDLFSGYKLVVEKSPITEGFSREEFFEARLIPHFDNFVFAGAFCFHPPQASRFILKEIKKIKKIPEEEQAEARENLISRLFKMRYKFEQYRHVQLDQIYSNDSKLGL